MHGTWHQVFRTLRRSACSLWVFGTGVRLLFGVYISCDHCPIWSTVRLGRNHRESSSNPLFEVCRLFPALSATPRAGWTLSHTRFVTVKFAQCCYCWPRGNYPATKERNIATGLAGCVRASRRQRLRQRRLSCGPDWAWHFPLYSAKSKAKTPRNIL